MEPLLVSRHEVVPPMRVGLIHPRRPACRWWLRCCGPSPV